MNEIGLLLKTTRDNSGVSIKEASEDLNISELVIENIEEGKIGCFKDIFALKNYIREYSKYLGLNPDKVIDEFNDYMFDYTSRIPTREIEKKVRKREKEIQKEKKIASPYTSSPKTKKKEYMLYLGFVLSFIAVVTSIYFIIKLCFFS